MSNTSRHFEDEAIYKRPENSATIDETVDTDEESDEAEENVEISFNDFENIEVS